MEVEQSRIFREKLSQWIASQGFWFQLRHSMQGGGGWSMAFSHLIRIAVRCLIVVVLLGLIAGAFLFYRTGSQSYVDGVSERLTAALGAKEVKVKDFRREAGQFKIHQIALEGTPDVFYNKLDASQIEFNPGLLGGALGSWDVGAIHVGQLHMNVKAGADNAAESQNIAGSLLKNYPNFKFTGLDVNDASIVWGFTSTELRYRRGFSTQGRIDNSRMKASRNSDGWHLEFAGGTFTQNWLEKAEILSMSADLASDHLSIKEAHLKLNNALIDLIDIEVTAGEKPQVTGRMKITGLDYQKALPLALKDFIEGSFSGEFKLSGSTNTTEGIVADGDVHIEGHDLVCLRDRLPLLKAMTVLDNYHTYRKIEFNEGTFHLRTSAEKLVISKINLKQGDTVALKGELTVRQPTDQEIAEAAAAAAQSKNNNSSSITGGPSVLSSGEGVEASGEDPAKKRGDFNLKDAAKATNGKQGFDPVEDLFDRHAQERMATQANPEELARINRALRYEGSFTLSVPPDAFDRAEVLKEKYPVDSKSNLIPLEVPMSGRLSDVSIHFSEVLLQEGAHK